MRVDHSEPQPHLFLLGDRKSVQPWPDLTHHWATLLTPPVTPPPTTSLVWPPSVTRPALPKLIPETGRSREQASRWKEGRRRIVSELRNKYSAFSTSSHAPGLVVLELGELELVVVLEIVDVDVVEVLVEESVVVIVIVGEDVVVVVVVLVVIVVVGVF